MPAKSQQICTLNVTVSAIYKLFSYNYNTLASTISVVDNGDNTYTVTKDPTSIYTTIKAIFLDSNNNPTSSVYPMTITTINSTILTIKSSNNYLPAGKFILQALSSNGYAAVTP
jgi:hypothetical protein